MRKREKLTVWETGAYALSAFGESISTSLLAAFFMIYLTVYQGLNPIVVGALIFLSKIWDAVNDPMVAVLVNNTKSRLGKFKPWIIGGTFINGFTLAFLFLPVDFPVLGKYFYYIFVYILWGMSFTCVDIPFWSMLPSMAKSTNERNKISSVARMVGGFGGILSGSGSAMIITYLVPNGTRNPYAYMIVGGVLAVMFLFLMLFVILVNREKYDVPQSDLRFRDVFQVFLQNDQLRVFAISNLLLTTAINMALYQPMYLFLYDYKRLFFGMYIIFNVVACTVQGWIMIAYPFLAKKIDRKKIYCMLFMASVIGLVGMFLIFFVLKEMPYEQGATAMLPGWEMWTILNIVLLSIPASFLNTANGVGAVCTTVMAADISDYHQYKTGQRLDSVMFSVQTLLTKVAQAFVSLIMGFGLTLSGLPAMEQTVNEAGEAVNTFSGVVTEQMLLILRGFMFLAPIPLVLIGYVIYKKHYTLTGPAFEEMKSKLDYSSKAEK